MEIETWKKGKYHAYIIILKNKIIAYYSATQQSNLYYSMMVSLLNFLKKKSNIVRLIIEILLNIA